MKKALLIVLTPFLVVALGAVGFVWWDTGAPPGMRPKLVDVTVDSITRENRGVRISGTAHYEVRAVQRDPSDPQDTWYLFPLMNKQDTAAREIKVMIRTRKKADDLYGFEDLTLEGLARPPGMLMPSTVMEQFEHRGYYFADGFVLVAEYD